jgi:hypothetical protein
MKKIQGIVEAKGLATEFTQDEEYGAFDIAVKFQLNGMSTTSRINMDLIESTEYRNLYKIFRSSTDFGTTSTPMTLNPRLAIAAAMLAPSFPSPMMETVFPFPPMVPSSFILRLTVRRREKEAVFLFPPGASTSPM